jgi:hypothetical protein
MIMPFRLPGSAMPPTERVTVTLPVDLVERIDRLESNRSRFVGLDGGPSTSPRR